MLLTIDAGNTRTKWATFNEANAVIASGAFNNADLGISPTEWADCSLAVISNVAGDMVADKLKAMMLPAMRQHWIMAAASGFGINNRYEQPEQLGSDRWAALIGARQYTEQNCLVVNAGTALTLDALLREPVSGAHIFAGGVILPGLHLMQQALAQGTHGIHQALHFGQSARQAAGEAIGQTRLGKHAELPRNTEDAIYTGALLAMVGAIEQMSLRLQRKNDTSIHCMLSGGDALLLANLLRSGAAISDIVIIEDLVLRGLLVIGREI